LRLAPGPDGQPREVEGAAGAPAPPLQPVAGRRNHGRQLAGLPGAIFTRLTPPIHREVARRPEGCLDLFDDLLRGPERKPHPAPRPARPRQSTAAASSGSRSASTPANP